MTKNLTKCPLNKDCEGECTELPPKTLQDFKKDDGYENCDSIPKDINDM